MGKKKCEKQDVYVFVVWKYGSHTYIHAYIRIFILSLEINQTKTMGVSIFKKR